LCYVLDIPSSPGWCFLGFLALGTGLLHWQTGLNKGPDLFIVCLLFYLCFVHIFFFSHLFFLLPLFRRFASMYVDHWDKGGRGYFLVFLGTSGGRAGLGWRSLLLPYRGGGVPGLKPGFGKGSIGSPHCLRNTLVLRTFGC
jgi:hypothetical protein